MLEKEQKTKQKSRTYPGASYKKISYKKTKCIKVLVSSGYFIIDCEDLEKIEAYNWYCRKYVIEGRLRSDSKKFVSLGRLILGIDDNKKKVLLLDKTCPDYRKCNLKTSDGVSIKSKFYCTYCKIKFSALNRPSRKNRFCSSECSNLWRKTDVEFRMRSVQWGLKYGGQNKIYTPELILRFTQWKGPTCSFPLCMCKKMPKSKWNLCILHYGRFTQALREHSQAYKQRIELYENSQT